MKRELISVTLDKSHSPIGLWECRSRGAFRQLSTAYLSCALDCGENTNWPSQEFGDMEIRRANKMAWRCESNQIVVFWCIVLCLVSAQNSRFIFMRLCQCTSVRLTRVRGQHFEIMPSNIPEVSETRPCKHWKWLQWKSWRKWSMWDCVEWMLRLIVRPEVACTSSRYRALWWDEWQLVFTLV